MSINKPTVSTLHRIDRIDLKYGLLIFVGVLILYIRTLVPDLLLGDSGEFQTLFYTLGMTHPTGYPIFILLGRLFTLLPMGTLTWRANLFIAFQGALIISCIYLLVRVIIGWRIAGIYAGFVLAINPLFWFYAVIAELYIPASLLTALIVLLIFQWRYRNQLRYLVLAGMIGGLSLGVHSTVALLALAILVYLFIVKGSKKTWVAAIAGGVIGLLLFAASFLIIDKINSDAGYYHATVEHSLSTWQMTESDFDSPVERFPFLYLGKQFQYQMFANPKVVMANNGEGLLFIFKETFIPFSIVFGIIGLLYVLVRHWREGVLLFLAASTQLLFALNYEVYDYYVFFIPAFVFIAVFSGVGVGAILEGVSYAISTRVLKNKIIRYIPVSIGLIILLAGVYAAYPILSNAWQEKSVTFIRNTQLDEYPYPIDTPQEPHQQALAVVSTLEEDAILFTDWEMLFPYYFVAQVEEHHPGMDFHETYPQDDEDGLSFSTLMYIQNNLDRPIYFSQRPHGTYSRELILSPVKKDALTFYQVEGIN